MDPEIRENFDRVYHILTRIELNCSNVSSRFDNFKSSIKLGHIFLFIVLLAFAGKIWLG